MYNTLRIKKNIYFVAVLLLSSIFQSCSSDDPGSIYKKGRKWVFNVAFSAPNGKSIDSGTLIMDVKSITDAKPTSFASFIFGQKDLTFSDTFNNRRGQILNSTTSISEDEGEVSVPSPEFSNATFTTIPPAPSVSFPISIGNSKNMHTNINKSEFALVNGKTIDQHQVVTGKKQFTFNGKALDCFVIKGWNTNYLKELGQYQCEFLFNNSYGFVSFIYKKPNGETVNITLRETNF